MRKKFYVISSNKNEAVFVSVPSIDNTYRNWAQISKLPVNSTVCSFSFQKHIFLNNHIIVYRFAYWFYIQTLRLNFVQT